MASPTFADFMARVVPWPTAGEGVINVHWTLPDKNGVPRGGMGGKPFGRLNDLLSYVAWAKTKPVYVKDLYYCLSQQKQAGTNKAGRTVAIRNIQNATALRAIWADVDGNKEPPKGYPSKDAALDAVTKFCKDAELPLPNAIVDSGNGLHVYWISNRALTVDEWRPYAVGLWGLIQQHGLHADPVTTDAARVLRIPDTFNQKSAPPKPVRLLRLEADFDFLKDLGKLLAVQGTAPVYQAPLSSSPIRRTDLILNPALFPKRNHTISEPLAPDCRREEIILDVFSVAQQCPHFNDALRNGGVDHNQGLWMQTILASTFMENGLRVAHKLSNKHPTYTVEATNAMYARKVADREQRGLGWPSCQTFENNGCKLCAKCPHKGRIRSPLNLGSPPAQPPPAAAFSITAPVTPPPPQAAAQAKALMIPTGYLIGTDGNIGYKKGDAGLFTPLFLCKITDVWTKRGNRPQDDAISFTFTKSKGHSAKATIPQWQLATPALLAGALGKESVLFDPKEITELSHFMAYWMEEIHKVLEARETVPLGWWDDTNGFAYNGVIHHRDGSTTPTHLGDHTTRHLYTPKGSADPWYEAANLIIAQRRPSVEVILATAFAAPLMRYTGFWACGLVANSLSGGNKSTACDLAKAVWGNPKLTGEVASASSLGLLHKVGMVRNLPFYWDDVREPRELQNCAVTLHQLTMGKEGAKQKQDGTARELKDWQTLLTVCSNKSIFDIIVANHKDDAASLNRILEYKVDKPVDKPGKFPLTPGRLTDLQEPQRIMAKLEENYGQLGEGYVQLMIRNSDKVRASIKTIQDRFSRRVKNSYEERYWMAIVGVILAGAQWANYLHVGFHLKEMEDFLEEVYIKMRKRVGTEASQGDLEESADICLANYISAHKDEIIMTMDLPPSGRRGRVMIKEAPFYDGPQKVKGAEVRIRAAVKPRKLMILRPKFHEWMLEKRYTPSNIYDGLRELYGMTVNKEIIGRGTTSVTTQNWVLTIDVPAGSWLEELLYIRISPSEIPKDFLTHSDQSEAVAMP